MLEGYVVSIYTSILYKLLNTSTCLKVRNKIKKQHYTKHILKIDVVKSK